MHSNSVKITLGKWFAALRRLGRVLTLRFSRRDIIRLDWRCLTVGLIWVWLVGVGRHWDDPNAELLQQSGIGSLVYVFLLALLLWIVIRPVAPRPIGYFQTLTFISLTAPPAVLYAVPIQWWVGPVTTIYYNAAALTAVSVYRVALLALFYRRGGQLHIGGTILTILLPLTFILTVLAATRLGTAIASTMGGLRDQALSSAEQLQQQFDQVILNLSGMSLLAFPLVLLIYIVWSLRLNGLPSMKGVGNADRVDRNERDSGTGP